MESQSIIDSPVTHLKGIGKSTAEQLAKCGIERIIDLLFHLPHRYQDRTQLMPIQATREGDYAVIEGSIVHTYIKTGRKTQFICDLLDHSGKLSLHFFHFSPHQQQQLCVGTQLRCFGEVQFFMQQRQMVHPEYSLVNGQQTYPNDVSLTPIYPSTAGLKQRRLRQCITQALDLLQAQPLEDYLPAPIKQKNALMPLRDALVFIHNPPPSTDVRELEAHQHPVQQRLILEELITQQLALIEKKKNTASAPAFHVDHALENVFLQNLPYSLTAAQKKVALEVKHDLSRNTPMQRLVQGDVGCGKTVIAALASLQAIAAKHQVAFMAPTELLAEQHYQQFTRWLTPLKLNVIWLAGNTKGQQRKAALAQINNQHAHIVIGTHALFQAEVHFGNLGLIIIDEQHRFGVKQRFALREKGQQPQQIPHQLMMTATPIPRTLHMAAYTHLAMSTIDELPPGRTPVTTSVLCNSRRETVIQRIHHACLQGQQIYWVCPFIEASEWLECQAAEHIQQQLQQQLPNISVDLLHGRLKSPEKDKKMRQFKDGKTQLLVATTVIEVGVDVPNASIMVIENAERLGLAQLHQLRGRVGRGKHASYCLLLYQAPLSKTAKARLKVLRDSHDGFHIAEQDLLLRGPGEVLGTQQSGNLMLRIADIIRDQALLPLAQQAAQDIIEQHPQSVNPLIKRWLGNKAQWVTME